MSWSTFFKSKEDEQYDEFLMNPKEVYARLEEKFIGLEGTIENLRKENKDLKEEVKDSKDVLNREEEEFYQEQAKYLDKIDTLNLKVEDLGMQTEIEKERLVMKFLEDKKEMIAMFKTKYDMSIAMKEAELEKDYHHEMHIVIEEQYEKYKEMIPRIIRETIIGFHNGDN